MGATDGRQRPAPVRSEHGIAPYRGRFAPSPSGWLHLGNARTALFAWMRARLAGGTFVMRVEDLDAPRTKAEAVAGNLAELHWLGLDWDEGPDLGGPFGPYRQSERLERYAAALERLDSAGALSESYLSRREVAEIAAEEAERKPIGPAGRGPGDSELRGGGGGDGHHAGLAVDDAGEGPADGSAALYGPAHRLEDAEVAAQRRAHGRGASLRFTVPAGTIEFVDEVRGPVRLDPLAEVGDFIVRRADGLFAYQLAVVVDDAEMAVTEVARGSDLLTSTAAQLLLYDALGLPAPRFAHVGLLLDVSGEKLSKRHGALALHELEVAGVRPERVVGLLAHSLGWLPQLREIAAAELLAVLHESGAAAAPAGHHVLSEEEHAWLEA